jgi:hypothetical protein
MAYIYTPPIPIHTNPHLHTKPTPKLQTKCTLKPLDHTYPSFNHIGYTSHIGYTKYITWAHYTFPHPQHKPTTTSQQIHITYNNHKASTTSTCHSPTNTHNSLLITPISQLTTSTPHINITTHIGCITYVTHTHLKTLKTKTIHYYTWNNSTIILLGGDIHTNPPSPTHPT